MATTVSSPGKVLIAGGYLVLDPTFSGTVVSTSSRFYTTVAPSGGASRIQVRSPQFLDATWDYLVNVDPNGVLVDQEITPANTSRNKFVHLALQNTLSLVSEIKGAAALIEALDHGLSIVIVGDNDFYSQRAKLASLKLPRTLSSLSQIPPFSPTHVRLPDVHKTGLGSSAALITSLVTALLLHFSAIPQTAFADDLSEGKHLAHNLAQYVHCLAQGKVGSGFDVSSAVFGSQLYTRFDPTVLQALMNDEAIRKQALLPILSPSNSAWNYRIEPFRLPPLTRLMLADVDAGSDTPSLVGKVLKWRKDNDIQAGALWNTLDQLNQSLAQTLLRLSRFYAEDEASYVGAIKYITSLQPVQWLANPSMAENTARAVQVFHEVHVLAEGVRAKMREMGELSGVPIEPKEQTNLLDVCMSQAGVIGGGVPGAGGYDAIWLLVCDPGPIPDQQPVTRVEHLWETWKELNVSPLSAIESTGNGVRLEDPNQIPGLINAVSGH